MVGGEGGEVLNGVLGGLVAHEDGDLGNPDCLGHTLSIHKLFVCIIRDLVVDWGQPKITNEIPCINNTYIRSLNFAIFGKVLYDLLRRNKEIYMG